MALGLSLPTPRRWHIKVHRMTKHFRPRSKSWKTGHLIMLSLIGFVWYSLISKRTHREEGSSLIRHIQGIRGSIHDRESYHQKNVDSPPQRVQEVNLRPPIHTDKGEKVASVREQQNINDRKKKPPPVDDNRFSHKKKATPKDDDPFNRKSLGINDEMKLAEREPVEAQGRKTRPKLGAPITKSPLDGKAPIILIWKAMEYQMKNYKEHLEFYTTPECGGCQITTNRARVRQCAALVHFNSPDLRKMMDVPDPKDRNPNQLYVFWSRETPAKTYGFSDILKDPRFDPIFNLTMNFRLDSDIVDYFGNWEYELHFFAEKQRFNGWFEKMMSRKSGLAVWAVSNCNSTYGAAMRMKYAKSLIRAGLNLTAYGTCFGNRNNGADLMQELMKHKFYISFENSIHCPDYVSEKFWRNGLRAGAVPIIWGPTREDVLKIAPPHSYIHTDDFKSPKKLIKYLEYLDKNNTAYREYHAWRFRPIDESIPYEEIVPTHRSSLCRLCKKVVEKPLLHKTIPSIYNWLYKTRYVDDLCFKS